MSITNFFGGKSNTNKFVPLSSSSPLNKDLKTKESQLLSDCMLYDSTDCFVEYKLIICIVEC